MKMKMKKLLFDKRKASRIVNISANLLKINFRKLKKRKEKNFLNEQVLIFLARREREREKDEEKWNACLFINLPSPARHTSEKQTLSR